MVASGRKLELTVKKKGGNMNHADKAGLNIPLVLILANSNNYAQ